MSDIRIRIEGRAGRITLTRPKALNALTYAMCTAIEEAIDTWRDDANVALVILDAEGDRAFCAGGDIAEMYRTGIAGDLGYGRRFWRDEYRLNAKLADYPKPIVAFLNGFTMGGGVGLGGHVSHRITGESSRISMPECGIGFVPDVGGTYRLARAPGRLGAYLGLTAARMNAGDAIHAGFADVFVPEDRWPDLKQALIMSGDPGVIADSAASPPASPLAQAQPQIDRVFAGTDLCAILSRLDTWDSPLADAARAAMTGNAPLSMATTLHMLDRLGAPDTTIRDALELEYRVSHRIMAQGDFLEGIRAAIIDKDRMPRWRHAADSVPPEAVEALLAPLGPDTLTFQGE